MTDADFFAHALKELEEIKVDVKKLLEIVPSLDYRVTENSKDIVSHGLTLFGDDNCGGLVRAVSDEAARRKWSNRLFVVIATILTLAIGVLGLVLNAWAKVV
jgi:hypothetical protein